MMMKNSKKQMNIPRGPRTQEKNNQRGKHQADSSDKGIDESKKASTAVHKGAKGLKHGRHGKKRRLKLFISVLVVLLAICAGAVFLFVRLYN